jgi:Protein of unknown function (DUF3732)
MVCKGRGSKYNLFSMGNTALDMQIRDIVLYSKTGQKRVLSFQVGSVNIISGSSKTGKSALIDIVDYCLGRSSCKIAVGPIRDEVEWYAIRLQFPSSQIFVARKSPPINANSTNIAFLHEAREVDIPDVISQQNTTIDAVITHINSRLEISPNLNTPPVGQTRSPLTANFRHALFLCFQTQNDLISRDELFHRQNDNDGLIGIAIKDALPYFLEAVREDALRLEHELSAAKRELKIAKRELSDAESVKGEGISNAVRLVSEANQVGLIDNVGDMPDNLGDLTQLLQQAAQWSPPENLILSDNETSDPSRLEQLQNQIRDLQERSSQKYSEINAAEAFAQEEDAYKTEANQQKARLESVGLFDNLLRNNAHNSETCPFCSHQLSQAIPNVDAMRNSLKKINQDLSLVDRDRPQLREHICKLQAEYEAIRERLKVTYQEIEGIIRHQDSAKRWRQNILSRTRTVARIDFWLENAVFNDETFELRNKVSSAELKVQEILSFLNPEDKQDRLLSALNRISLQMTQWAAELQLEHADGQTPIRLDMKRATVIVDSPERLIPLNLIGAGENVEGYHLITHLALHKYFVDRNRPTPRFLFLDQPSQVYYPASPGSPEVDDNAESIKDTGLIKDLDDQDQQSLKKFFNFIFDAFEQYLSPNFQIIITDHANLIDNNRFQAALIEIWRNGKKLVPIEWTND